MSKLPCIEKEILDDFEEQCEKVRNELWDMCKNTTISQEQHILDLMNKLECCRRLIVYYAETGEVDLDAWS